jgi:hypothetical protein
MQRRLLPLLVLSFLPLPVLLVRQERVVHAAVPWLAAPLADGPAYTADGRLKFPERYREWVFLTSGVDMSYTPKAGAAEHTMFDNVFVNPSAYKAFLANGTWPDGTVMVLENRGGESARSINTRGRTQSLEVMGMEVHVKDAAGPNKNLPGGWAFYGGFDDRVSGKLIGRPASCYTCHEQHAAVDTTFVQFYPTLLKLAEAKGTISPAYLKEMAAPAK